MDISFEEGMNKLATYLKKYPTEFFVIHIFRGNNGNQPDISNTLYNQALNNDHVKEHIVEFRPNLTVREARGKIVITVRDRASYLQHDKQADIQNWRTSFNDNQRSTSTAMRKCRPASMSRTYRQTAKAVLTLRKLTCSTS